MTLVYWEISVNKNKITVSQRSGPKLVKGCVIGDRKLRSEILRKQVDFFFEKTICWGKKN